MHALIALRTGTLLALAATATVSAACTGTPDDAEVIDDVSGGKGDASTRFVEVDPTRSSKRFRDYIHRALNEMEAQGSELALETLRSLEQGYVLLDEVRDLTCADFEHVRKDLPALGLTPEDRAKMLASNSPARAAIEEAIAGYQWGNRIYVARGLETPRLAATLVHEVNHVLNRSEFGYYDDLPTSAFLHEYRAFHVESLYNPDEYKNVDLMDYVITTYEYDRSKIKPEALANPVTPLLIPDEMSWKKRAATPDPIEPIPDVCR